MRQVPAPTSAQLLAALGGAALVIGAAASLGLVFGPPAGQGGPSAVLLVWFSDRWRWLFGWAALPAALGLVWAGLGLVWRRHADPWQLPWGRALALELALAAALALTALGRGPLLPDAAGPGGLVGWALVAATRAWLGLGPAPATLLWLAVGLLGVLGVFRVGARGIADQLNTLADSLTAAPVAGGGGPGPGQSPAAGPGSAASPGPSVAPMPGQQSPLPAASSPAPPAAATPPADPASASPTRPRPPTRARSSASTPAPPLTARSSIPPTPEPPSPSQPPLPSLSHAASAPARQPSGGRKVVTSDRAPYLPGPELLRGRAPSGPRPADGAAQAAMAETIVRTLASFGVPAEVVAIEPGPTYTRFGLKPGSVTRAGQARRVPVGRIVALRQDLALALAVSSIRIEAPIPGRALVGIEVPNAKTDEVGLRTMVESPAWGRAQRKGGLAIALGRDVSGEAVAADLAQMPHLLVAGTTGSGKSVCLSAILASLLYENSPDALALVLIDPKRVELAAFSGLPHLVAPVVTDWREAIGALHWVILQMDERFRQIALRGVRDRAGYNARAPAGTPPMPALVVVIDELADLMLAAPLDTEPLVTRLAQLGRAAGIHLVAATQRPSVDVVTGLIKANFPARIAFTVASSIDSRVILDRTGAEALLGRGDMLYQAPDAPDPRRLQGVLVTDREVAALVAFWKRSPWQGPGRLPPWDDLVPSDDPDAALYAQAQDIAASTPDLSPSLLQRRLRVGYAKARALYERLVEDGLVDEGRGDEGGGDTGGSGSRGGYGADCDDAGESRRPRRDLDWVDREFDG